MTDQIIELSVSECEAVAGGSRYTASGGATEGPPPAETPGG